MQLNVVVKFSDDEKKKASFVSYISLLLHLCPKTSMWLDTTAGVLPSLATPWTSYKHYLLIMGGVLVGCDKLQIQTSINVSD